MFTIESISSLGDFVLVSLSNPQQFILLLLLGLWLWQYELMILSKSMNVSRVLCFNYYDISPQPTSVRIAQVTKRFVKKVTRIFIPWHLIISYFLFKIQRGDREYPVLWVLIVNISPLVQCIMLLWTMLHESKLFFHCVLMMFFCAEVESTTLNTNYIFLSDTLTSYSKPLMDFFLYIVQILQNPVNTKMLKQSQNYSGVLQLDLIVGSIPFLIRFIQCLREYTREPSGSAAKSLNLYNALKYFTNFPIFIFMALSRVYTKSTSMYGLYCLMLLNSCFGFWWDVTVDWKLGFLDFSARGRQRNEFLRNRMIYGAYTYYAAILFEFVIKFTWLWDLLFGKRMFKGEFNFIFYFMEILRRWVWSLMKIEAEYLSTIEKR